MKCKVFTFGVSREAAHAVLEEQINKWLQENPDISAMESQLATTAGVNSSGVDFVNITCYDCSN